MMSYELLRALRSRNSAQYSDIVGVTPHFYPHIGAGPKVIPPPLCKHMWSLTF